MKSLENRFLSLLVAFENKALIQSKWAEIHLNYNEPHRAYHNLSHLEAMFQQLDNVQDKVEDLVSFKWAIFYHDIIYKNKLFAKNEKESADLAQACLPQLGVNEKTISKVKSYILATEKHTLAESVAPNDLAYFLDIDLSILGKSTEKYLEYCDQIRTEYLFVPNKLYKIGRSKILKSFLKRPNIFFTAYFQDHFEKQAIENLNLELKRLS